MQQVKSQFLRTVLPILTVITAFFVQESYAVAEPYASTTPPISHNRQPRKVSDAESKVAKSESNHRLAWALTSSDKGLAVESINPDPKAVNKSTLIAILGDEDSRISNWTGEGCLEGDGHSLAVAFAPGNYANTDAGKAAGASAAIVNLENGHVSPLPQVHSSLAYFSPNCGTDGGATFTGYNASYNETYLWTLRAGSDSVNHSYSIPGQVASAITDSHGHVTASDREGIVDETTGERIAKKPGYRFENLTPLHDGSVLATLEAPQSTKLVRIKNHRIQIYGSAEPGSIGIQNTEEGPIVLASSYQGLTPEATKLLAVPRFSHASADGTTFTQEIANPTARNAPRSERPARSESPRDQSAIDPISITYIDVHNGITNSQIAPSELLAGLVATPAQSEGASKILPNATPTPTGTTNSTLDPNIPCSVQRNDPNIMAYQPSIPQVEWAVDHAIAGALPARPANYRSESSSAIDPQKLFPLPKLTGGGSIPPQVLLGILANESNLNQASGHVARGSSGSPITGNIYGTTGDAPSVINPSNSDCGYGIAQITDGMRTGELPATTQRAVAQDYSTNIAAAAQILATKWNQLKSSGMTVNGGDPQWIENWYYAAWAYNSGIHTDDGAGNSGLGWANNPSNPIYPANRSLFNSDPRDAAHPSHWPYQERVIGWAANPIYQPSGPGASYSQAWWTTDATRNAAIPAPQIFCTGSNHCTLGSGDKSNFGVCGLANLHCWSNFPVTWKDCSSGSCGHAQVRFNIADAEPADPTSADPAVCSRSPLPSNAIVVDDLPSARYSPCGTTASSGSFQLTFPLDSSGNVPAHMDLVEINGGLNGHYWLSHQMSLSNTETITGTWTLPAIPKEWGSVLVHVPALGSTTRQARYVITDKATGKSQFRVVDMDAGVNQWVPIGSMELSSYSTISLTAVAPHEIGANVNQDVAWDAVAFTPTPRPKYIAVALGDSYSSGEGNPPFIHHADGDPSNACDRSQKAYSQQMIFPGSKVSAMQDSTVESHFLACSGAISTSLDPEAAATDPHVSSISDDSGALYQDGQEGQLDTGFVNSDTDIVTLTAGGNDARFAALLKGCITDMSFKLNCFDSVRLSGDGDVAAKTEPGIITGPIAQRLGTLYKDIAAKAPHAKIYVGGYPTLFDSGIACSFIDPTDISTIRSWTSLLNGVIKSQVSSLQKSGVKIYYVDTDSEFNGGKRMCESGNQFNGIDILNATYSFHPNSIGQAAMARAFTKALGQH